MSNRSRPFHRLKEVRQLSGMSLRSIAARTGIPIKTLREQEVSNQIDLSDLFKWKEALGVPFMELFSDSPEKMDEMVRIRAGLIQIMRSVNSLRLGKLTEQQEAIVENIGAELTSLMPELDAIGSWPQSGNRRRLDEPSRIESHLIPTDLWFTEVGNEV